MSAATFDPEFPTAGDTSPLMSSRSMARVFSVALLVLLLVSWELAIRQLAVPMFLFPAPSAIAKAMLADVTSGVVWPHLWVTLAEVLGGFILAVAAGVLLGGAIALFPAVELILYPYVIVLQTIPKIAIAPLLIIWLGFGIQSKLVIAASVAFFPIFVNVLAGLKTVDVKQVMLMRTLRATPLTIFLKVRIPNTLPYLVAGLDVAIVFAVIGAVVGEFIGSSVGLGSLIVQRQASMDVAGVFAAIFFLSVLSLLLTATLRFACRNLAFWTRMEEAISA